MSWNFDLSLLWEQVNMFWAFLGVVLGLVLGAVLLRFIRFAIRESISWLRERLDYRAGHM